MIQLRGVNLSGAEFGGGTLPGNHNQHYSYQALWNGYGKHVYFIRNGANCIRMPFLWERLQRTLLGPLDDNELKRLKDTVHEYRGLGVRVIIDPHNYARYNGTLVTAEQLSDLWRRLAREFEEPDHIFGLMNEPHGISVEAWWSIAQAVTNTIRAENWPGLILVPGVAFSTAQTWISSGNAAAALGFVDNGSNYAFEVHQYLNAASDGADGTAVSTTIGVERITAATLWAAANNRRLFLGEFGVSTSLTNRIAAAGMIAYMDARPATWLGWTAWGAGGWWAPTYHFRLDPPDADNTALIAGSFT